MAVIFQELCNGGADGVDATTGNTSFADLPGSGTAVFDTAESIEGGTAILFSPQKQAEFTVSGGQLFMSFYARFTATPTNSYDLNLAMLSGSIKARVRIFTDGTFRLLDGGVTVSTSSHIMVPGQWYRIEWTIDSAAGQQHLAIYTGADLHALTPTETLANAPYATSDVDTLTVARAASTGTDTSIDRIIVDNAAMPAPFSPTIQPVADAGPNQTVAAGSLVTLVGAASGGAGGPYEYLWEQLTGTPVTLSDPTAQSPTFTAPMASGVPTFGLKVTDSASVESAQDTITVTVVGAGATARPISDIEVTGWETEPDSAAGVFEVAGDGEDSTYARYLDPVGIVPLEDVMSELTEPGSVPVRMWFKPSMFNATSGQVTMIMKEGEAVIATSGPHNWVAPEAVQYFEYTLTPAERASVANWANVRMRFEGAVS